MDIQWCHHVYWKVCPSPPLICSCLLQGVSKVHVFLSLCLKFCSTSLGNYSTHFFAVQECLTSFWLLLFPVSFRINKLHGKDL